MALGVIKHNINGSDYVGVFATSTDRYAIAWDGLPERERKMISESLGVECIATQLAGSNLVGILARGNSNGLLLSNMASDSEVERIAKSGIDIKVGRLMSDLNTVGNNIIVNDKIAIVNPDYSRKEMDEISEILGVDAVGMEFGGFKTVGANNILTNKGMVINNRSTEREEERARELTGFEIVRTTANTGGLNIGLAAFGNSFGALIGESTTGFESARIIEGLGIDF